MEKEREKGVEREKKTLFLVVIRIDNRINNVWGYWILDGLLQWIIM